MKRGKWVEEERARKGEGGRKEVEKKAERDRKEGRIRRKEREHCNPFR